MNTKESTVMPLQELAQEFLGEESRKNVLTTEKEVAELEKRLVGATEKAFDEFDFKAGMSWINAQTHFIC